MTNTLSPGDKVLIARFGQFSLLWADMCTRMGLEVDVVDDGVGIPGPSLPRLFLPRGRACVAPPRLATSFTFQATVPSAGQNLCGRGKSAAT